MKKLISYASQLFMLYVDKGISGMAAQLSYYMLFSFFPLLLLGSTTLARLVPQDFCLEFGNVIPLPVRQLAYGFISEISQKSGERVMLAAALLCFYSLTKYIRCYRLSIRKIYGISPRFNFIVEWIYSFLFSAALFLLFCLAVVCVFFTDNLMNALGLGFIAESIWFTLRFFALAIYAFFVLSLIHKAEHGRTVRLRKFYVGSASAIFAWSIISALFSYYVDKITDYSVLYGSIGNVIMLLVWLNLTNYVLLLSACINTVLKEKC